MRRVISSLTAATTTTTPRAGDIKDLHNAVKMELLFHFNCLLGESDAADLYFELLVKSLVTLRFDVNLQNLERRSFFSPSRKVLLFQTIIAKLGVQCRR